MGAAGTSTVPRLLTKRTQFTVTLLILLAFPAAALAANSGKDPAASSGSLLIGRAQVAGPAPAPAAARTTAALRQPGKRFHHLVATISQQIRVEARQAELKRQREEEERFADLPGGVSISTLEAIASCESGGDPTAVSSDGTYRGKYQFDFGTWESVGGQGDPAAAPEAEQDYRAALLYSRSGSSPWPICG
jgi:TolA-binding protein